jgi:hypothetical protein
VAKINIKNTHSKKRSIIGKHGVLTYGQIALVDESFVSKVMLKSGDITIVDQKTVEVETAVAAQDAAKKHAEDIATVIELLKSNPNQFDKEELVKTSFWKKGVPTVEAILRVFKVEVSEDERDIIWKSIQA